MNINITVNVTDQSLASFIKRGIIFADLVARDIAKNAKSEKRETPTNTPKEEPSGEKQKAPEHKDETEDVPTYSECFDAYQKCLDKYGSTHDDDIQFALDELRMNGEFDPNYLPYLLDAVGEDHPVYRYAKFVTERDAD